MSHFYWHPPGALGFFCVSLAGWKTGRGLGYSEIFLIEVSMLHCICSSSMEAQAAFASYTLVTSALEALSGLPRAMMVPLILTSLVVGMHTMVLPRISCTLVGQKLCCSRSGKGRPQTKVVLSESYLHPRRQPQIRSVLGDKYGDLA